MSSAFDPSERFTYGPEQIQAYFDTISLPAKYRESPALADPLLARTITYGLPLLIALQKHQLASIPFENLTLHYNPRHNVTIQPDFVHNKFISSACGRGGRCMENNLLFYTVLLSLGFRVTSTAGRVNEAVQPASGHPDWSGPRYDGWNHRVTLVHFSDDKTIEAEDGVKEVTRTFLVDTGFGALCPNQPLELNRDSPTRVLNVPPAQQSRIRWTTIPDVVNKKQMIWVYETRVKLDEAEREESWTPTYCFSETEFLPVDYAMMSFFTSTNPSSWFTFSVVCVKMVLQDDVIVGDVTLFNNVVKRRLFGKSEVLETLETEEQRVAALEKWFGIVLSEEEREAVRGTAVALA